MSNWMAMPRYIKSMKAKAFIYENIFLDLCDTLLPLIVNLSSLEESTIKLIKFPRTPIEIMQGQMH